MITGQTNLSKSDFKDRANSGAAALNRRRLASAGVFAIVVTGGPSCGKTALIKETLKHLCGELRCGAILGNIKAEQDAQELRGWCQSVQPIEAVDLDAELVREALECLDLSQLDVLFIERASASPPMPRDLGQSATIGVFSVAGGDNKVSRHPEHIHQADLAVLTKCDLLPVIPFDRHAFAAAVHKVNREARIIETSAASHVGLDELCGWIRDHVHKIKDLGKEPAPTPFAAEYFVG